MDLTNIQFSEEEKEMAGNDEDFLKLIAHAKNYLGTMNDLTDKAMIFVNSLDEEKLKFYKKIILNKIEEYESKFPKTIEKKNESDFRQFSVFCIIRSIISP